MIFLCYNIPIRIFLRGYLMLGERVKLLRLKKELTQKELAQLAGVSQSFISLLENGKKKDAGIVRIRRIAKALDVKLEFLLGIDEYLEGEKR